MRNIKYKRRVTILLDDDIFNDLMWLVIRRRANMSQVIRNMIVEEAERELKKEEKEKTKDKK